MTVLLNACLLVHYCAQKHPRVFIKDTHHNLTHIVLDENGNSTLASLEQDLPLSSLTAVQEAALYVLFSSMCYILYALVRTRYQNWKRKNFPNALVTEAAIVGLFGCIVYAVILGYTEMTLTWSVVYVAMNVLYRIFWWVVLILFEKRILQGLVTINMFFRLGCLSGEKMEWGTWTYFAFVACLECGWGLGIFLLSPTLTALSIQIYTSISLGAFALYSGTLIKISLVYVHALRQTEACSDEGNSKPQTQLPNEIMSVDQNEVPHDSSARLEAHIAKNETLHPPPKTRRWKTHVTHKTGPQASVFYQMASLAGLSMIVLSGLVTISFVRPNEYPIIIFLDCFRQAFVFFLSMTLPFRSSTPAPKQERHTMRPSMKRNFKQKQHETEEDNAPRYPSLDYQV